LRGATGDALAERDVVDLRQQHRKHLRRDALVRDEREQARGRIRAMDRARDALEVLERPGEDGLPVRLADEEFRETGGGLRHGKSGYAP